MIGYDFRQFNPNIRSRIQNKVKKKKKKREEKAPL